MSGTWTAADSTDEFLFLLYKLRPVYTIKKYYRESCPHHLMLKVTSLRPQLTLAWIVWMQKL